MELFYDILKQLIRVPSVVGAEHSFFMFVKRELEELEIDVEYCDGLIVAKGSEPDTGYISAHSDRHGLMCTGSNEFQYAAFVAKNKSDLQGNSISENLLKNFTVRFVGEKVQAYEPYSGSYLGLGLIKDAFYCHKRNNILFKVDNMKHLLPGTPIAFMDKLKLKDNLVIAQLDNVVSVAILIYMYHIGYKGTAFFTASEEAGRSWRFLLEWFTKNDLETKELLVLDTSPYSILDDIMNLDVVFRNRDANAYFRSPLKSKVKKIAIDNHIKYHFKDAYLKNQAAQQNKKDVSLGVTELGRIITASKGRIQGTTLQIPTIGYHTTEETCTAKSINYIFKILEGLYLSRE